MSDADFDSLIEGLDRASVTSFLVSASGPTTVTSKQRGVAGEVLRRRNTNIAVLTDSKVTIGMTTAVRWLGVANIRAFPYADREAAVRALNLQPTERAAALRVLSECETELVEHARSA